MTVEKFKEWLRRGSTWTTTAGSAARSCGARCAPSGRGYKCKRGIECADADGDGYIDDNEADGLIEYAQKSLGLKIAVQAD
jgi:calmodulin